MRGLQQFAASFVVATSLQFGMPMAAPAEDADDLKALLKSSETATSAPAAVVVDRQAAARAEAAARAKALAELKASQVDQNAIAVAAEKKAKSDAVQAAAKAKQQADRDARAAKFAESLANQKSSRNQWMKPKRKSTRRCSVP